jgi:hypothetical protein
MKHINQLKLGTFAAMSALGLSFLTAGCAHTISKTEETRVNSNGAVSTKEKTITQNPDGSINQTETRRTTNP